MSIVFIASLFFASLSVLGCYTYKVVKKRKVKRELSVSVGKFLVTLALCPASYATAMIMRTETSAEIMHSVSNILDALAMYNLLSCVKKMTGIKDKFVKQRKFLIIYFLVDTALLLLNPFFGFVFGCGTTDDYFGNKFYIISEWNLLFSVHISFMYICCFLVIGVLGKKISTSPSIYRFEYISIMTIVCLIAVSGALCVNYEVALDYTLLLYALLGFAIFYFAYIYVPRGLMERLLFFTIANIKDGIICIDIDGNVVHANKNARIYCDAELDPVSANQNITQQVTKWFTENIGSDPKDCSWESVRRIDGDTRYCNVEYKRIFDQRIKYLGCFFIIHDHTDEDRRLYAEKYRATHDALTGIYNKEYFYETAGALIRQNPDKQYYIVSTDVKNFKAVNDVFGVERGDELLKYIAEITESLCDDSCVYGRLQGDRFAMCLPEDRFDEEHILQEYSRVGRFMRESVFTVHVHIGIYEVDNPELRVSVMCDRANLAIKTIKDSYRSISAHYEKKLRDSLMNEQKVISGFENALATGQFRAFVQPQIFADGSIKGGEVLVRWIHPIDGMIPPYKFIEIFEQTGLISRLDTYMWELACIQLNKWNDMGFDNAYLSINISQKDFCLVDVYEVITGLVKKYCLHPKSLHLEITETAIMNNPSAQLPLIENLRKFGFIIEIDDFGSGYSSLNTLKDLSADVLKIDMGFLEKSGDSEKSKIILKMIISLAKSLDMEVITEGVETREQVGFLLGYGCDIFQGYYFSKPIPVNDFEEKFLNKKFLMN